MFFFIVYIFSSLVFGAVFSVISVSALFTPYLPPALALGMSPLLTFKTTLNLNLIVIKLGFILEAVYHYFLMG